VLLTPTAAFEWAPPPLAELDPDDLAPAFALEPPPEFILLGTGAGFAFAPQALRRALEDLGVGLEVMDSRAAARTWGVLRREERWIAAALMPIG
jgi:uncharacterized protein